MNTTELNWTTWLKNGDQYLKAAGTSKRFRFDTDVAYNLLGMSLESFVMAILDVHHSLPENHTFTDLMDALGTVCPVDNALREKILKYESIQSICSIDKYQRENPSEEAVNELREAVKQIRDMAHKICDQSTIS